MKLMRKNEKTKQKIYLSNFRSFREEEEQKAEKPIDEVKKQKQFFSSFFSR
jgi:hypothetical protein